MMDKDEYEKNLQGILDMENRIKEREALGKLDVKAYSIVTLAVLFENMKANLKLTKEIHLVLIKSDKLAKIALIVGAMSLTASVISLGAVFISQIPT